MDKTNVSRPSEKFTSILGDASANVHRLIIEEVLVPMLDSASSADAARALEKAQEINRHAQEAPKLDLFSKKTEVNGLLDELTKEATTRPYQIDQYEILLQEAVESIACWLNDVWRTVYEFGMEFARAHSCLLYSIGIVDHIQLLSSKCCHCPGISMFVPITIKNSEGTVIKSFMEVGISNVETAILWIWRDLFICLLASKNSKAFVKMIPDLVSEIDDVLNWRGLERLITGGEKLKTSMSGENNIEDISYAEHWDANLTRKAPVLLRYVRKRLTTIFRISPSYELYKILVTLCREEDGIRQELNDILSFVATTSASSMVAALKIYMSQARYDSIQEILTSHSFLLGPEECYTLQEAVGCLLSSPEHEKFALGILEAQLVDTLKTLHHHVFISFSHMDDMARRAEIQSIMRMNHWSSARSDAIRRWVDSATSPPPTFNNPMILAAMMVGLPVTVDELDDNQFLGMEFPPDLVEARERPRANMKNRFSGWISLASEDPCFFSSLERTYKEACNLMPWLRTSDIAYEMISRMQNKPSKEHVCEALEAVQKFIDKHRRRQRAAEKRNQADTREESAQSFFDDLHDINISYPGSEEILMVGDDDDYIFEDENDAFDRAPTPGPVPFITHAPEDMEEID